MDPSGHLDKKNTTHFFTNTTVKAHGWQHLLKQDPNCLLAKSKEILDNQQLHWQLDRVFKVKDAHSSPTLRFP
jgi:hypothetical protein